MTIDEINDRLRAFGMEADLCQACTDEEREYADVHFLAESSRYTVSRIPGGTFEDIIQEFDTIDEVAAFVRVLEAAR